VLANTDIVGKPWSILIPVTTVEALLPATSVHVPVTFCPAPSVDSVVGDDEEATPDNESAQLKLTVTGVLFQPEPFAKGELPPVMEGGVVSTFTGPNARVETFPAASMHFPVIVCPALEVSLAIVVFPIGYPEAIPLASAHWKARVTSRFVQLPAVYGPSGVIAVTEINGGVLSTLIALEVTAGVVSVTIPEPLLYAPVTCAVNVRLPSPLTGPQV
jgi:hypothetical protein